MAGNPKPRRRLLQFRLKTLLLIVAVLCVPLAWVGVRLNQKRHERAVIAEIERLGGRTYYDWQRGKRWGRPLLAVKPYSAPTGPYWCRRLLGNDFFSDVDYVYFPPPWHSKLNDDELRLIATFSKLAELDLSRRAAIDDHGLAYLNRLTSLRILDLSETNITDEGLVGTVANMTDLEELHLDWTNVGDAGLAKLSNLTKLRQLFFQHTNLTDACLGDLQKFTRLERLYLDRTQVTDEGVARFQQALPDCRVHR